MAILTDLTTGVQTSSATGALTPTTGLDVSGFTGDFTVCLEVMTMSVGKTARLQLEGTVNGFTTATALKVFDLAGHGSVLGGYSPSSQKFSVRRYELENQAGQYFGVAGGRVRLNTIAIDSATALAVHSWVEA